MINLPEETLDCFVEACHRAASHGLIRCSSGNLSLRLDKDRMLVTASRSWLGRLSADDVSLCLISDGSLLEGGKPSVEIGIHAGILRTRPDVNLVMHFQTPCATALACQASDNINYNVIPEIPFYIGPVARIPYVLPGSKELAQAVTDAMREHDMVVMGNHGQVTVACDADLAIQNAEFFELASEIILRSGDRVTPLPEKEVQTLLELRRAGKAVA
ncbi:MAG: class II aldolase/adducin family protein [Planctomycetes bacterium]|nr:class II aldolase/adducin family protein [Planctomycetota bacterium]